MTRKHFEAIAKIIRDARTSDGVKEEIGKALADFFETQNPNFRHDLFMQVVNNEAG
jgi:hypothetical protein